VISSGFLGETLSPTEKFVHQCVVFQCFGETSSVAEDDVIINKMTNLDPFPHVANTDSCKLISVMTAVTDCGCMCYRGLATSQTVLLTHGDSVATVAPGFNSCAQTADSKVAGQFLLCILILNIIVVIVIIS